VLRVGRRCAEVSPHNLTETNMHKAPLDSRNLSLPFAFAILL